jgi:hypothetical protein
MVSAALARLDDPLARSKLALRRSRFPGTLASGLCTLQPSNDNGETCSSYDEPASGSCFWVSKDRSRFRSKETDLYVYASNDPINRIDRTGHDSTTIGTIIIIGQLGGEVGGGLGVGGTLGGAGLGLLGGGLLGGGLVCTAAWLEGGPTPDEGPEEGGVDCNESCAQQGYARPGATYTDVDGYTWRNDAYGNAPIAFYKCVEECEQGL